jgi:hypothetical protein
MDVSCIANAKTYLAERFILLVVIRNIKILEIPYRNIEYNSVQSEGSVLKSLHTFRKNTVSRHHSLQHKVQGALQN